MKTQHTPGPWKVERDPEFPVGLHPYHEARYVTNSCAVMGDDFTDDPDAVIICVLRDAEEQAANARLIAAAPEMLAALDEVVTELSNWNHWATTTQKGYEGSSGWKTCCARINQARAAISKAKGGGR